MNAVKRRANEKSAKAFAAQCVGETEIKYAGNDYYDVHYTKPEAAKAKKLTHVLPTGEVATRSTKNNYTHVVECRVNKNDPKTASWFKTPGREQLPTDSEGWIDWGIWSWTSRLDLAEKEAAKVNKMSGWEARSVEIRSQV